MNKDVKSIARKIKRKIKSDRPKVFGLAIIACAAAPMPYAGAWIALAAGIFAFSLVAREFLAIQDLEMVMEDAEMPQIEIESVLPSYQPIIVNATLCLIALVAAAIIASKLTGTMAEILGVVA